MRCYQNLLIETGRIHSCYNLIKNGFFFARRKYRGPEEHVGVYGGSLMILVKEIDMRDWE
jgi:hypothetical protein